MVIRTSNARFRGDVVFHHNDLVARLFSHVATVIDSRSRPSTNDFVTARSTCVARSSITIAVCDGHIGITVVRRQGEGTSCDGRIHIGRAISIQLDRSRIRTVQADRRSGNIERIDSLRADLSRRITVAIHCRHREGPDEVVAALWIGIHTDQAAVKINCIAVSVAHIQVLITVVCGDPLNLTQSSQAGIQARKASTNEVGTVRAIKRQRWSTVVNHRDHLITRSKAGVSAQVDYRHFPGTGEGVGSSLFTTLVGRRTVEVGDHRIWIRITIIGVLDGTITNGIRTQVHLAVIVEVNRSGRWTTSASFDRELHGHHVSISEVK